MKKSDFLLIGIVILIVVLAIVLPNKANKDEEIEYPLTLTGTEGLTKLTYSEYEEKINNNEIFLLVVERTGCQYCELYMPIVEEITKEKNIEIDYIDTTELSEEEYNLLVTKNSYFRRNELSTPTTLLMKGSKVLYTFVGYKEKETVIELLKDKIVIGE